MYLLIPMEELERIMVVIIDCQAENSISRLFYTVNLDDKHFAKDNL